jgi:hypothetical protein
MQSQRWSPTVHVTHPYLLIVCACRKELPVRADAQTADVQVPKLRSCIVHYHVVHASEGVVKKNRPLLH